MSVDYETADGTAQEGADYVPLSGTVSFAPGETVKTVSVATLGDGNAEPAETLTLRLSNALGATLATPEASGTIEASTGASTFTGAFTAVPEAIGVAWAVATAPTPAPLLACTSKAYAVPFASPVTVQVSTLPTSVQGVPAGTAAPAAWRTR